MIEALIPWVADGLVLLGLLIMTISVYGILRMPDVYLSLHAASKSALVGMLPVLLAAVLTGGWAFAPRLLLIGVFLVLTTPVSAHIVGQAAYLMREPMRSPDLVDESGRLHPEEG